MTNNTIEITLLTSNKPGILSSIILKCGRLGLMQRKNHIEKINDEHSRMSIFFEGTLKCSSSELVEVLESLSEVHAVEKTSLSDAGATNPISSPDPTPAPAAPSNNTPSRPANTGAANLQAHDTITAESLKIAEEVLANFLGPVAPMLVESAAEKTKHIGDLYTLLAEELDPDERSSLLGLVKGLS